ncbi:MAG: hypothetical protein AB9897_01275 [Anaerolineaceae bacterium]
MTVTVPWTTGQELKSEHSKGAANIGNSSAFLTPTTNYADLVAAPASGILRVNQIVIKNIDTISAVFSIKLIRSATDYTVIQITLAANERFILEFPFLLNSLTKIQAKVSVTCAARITASCVVWEGEMALAAFSGTSWTDVIGAVPAGHAYSLLGFCVQNSDPTTQTISLQIIDGSSVVKWSETRTLGSGAVWINGENVVLAAGWKLQVKHGAASKTGIANASYLEVPA